jgi:hypothetical protein
VNQLSRVYKQVITECKICPEFEPGWCKRSKSKINIENITQKKIPSWCTLSRLPRSKAQNDYYWSVIIRTLGSTFGYTDEEMHETIKFMFLREQPIGKPIHIKSTADLNTKEAETMYEQIRTWAAMEYGIYIPEPNEI